MRKLLLRTLSVRWALLVFLGGCYWLWVQEINETLLGNLAAIEDLN